MKRLGQVLVLLAMVAMFIPAVAQSASAQAACTPGYPGCPPPTIDVPDPITVVGGRVVVTGGNWCPNGTVDIYLDGTILVANDVPVAADGTFSTTVTIPPGTSPGPHTLTVVGFDSSCQGTPVEQVRDITVLSGGGQGPGGGGVQAGGAAGAPSGGNLPFTGSNISAGMLILFALLIVGAVSLVAGRRRASHVKE
jgi:hypothetical protein